MAERKGNTSALSDWLDRTAASRFWARVNKTDSCWLWTAGLTRNKYGRFSYGRRHNILAHRFSWTMANQLEIPVGMVICHKCDVPTCVRPDHLFLGTQADNIRDAQSKGRMRGNSTPCRPDVKERLSAINKAREPFLHTEETKAKISAAKVGRRSTTPVSLQTRQKLREAGLRRDISHLHTPEARRKKAEAMARMTRVIGPEQRGKISVALSGRPKSDAHKLKLSLAQKRHLSHKVKKENANGLLWPE